MTTNGELIAGVYNIEIVHTCTCTCRIRCYIHVLNLKFQELLAIYYYNKVSNIKIQYMQLDGSDDIITINRDMYIQMNSSSV